MTRDHERARQILLYAAPGMVLEPKQIASFLGITASTVRRWARNPRCGKRLGGRHVMNVDGVLDLLLERDLAAEVAMKTRKNRHKPAGVTASDRRYGPDENRATENRKQEPMTSPTTPQRGTRDDRNTLCEAPEREEGRNPTG